MKIIVCVDENYGIGKDGKLLFSIPDDMKHFVEKTTDCILVMGRKTLFSFKNKAPLKGRINIVYTSDKEKLKDEYKAYDNIFFVSSKEEVSDVVKRYTDKYKDTYVIGGGKIYDMYIDDCNYISITKLYKKFDADTYFPDPIKHGYRETCKSDIKNYEGVKYQFIDYER